VLDTAAVLGAVPERFADLLVLLPLALAACSGGDDAERFCSEAEDALAGIDASGALGDDPQAFADAIAQQREGFESIDPPSEIADDWRTFATAFAELDDALQSVDTTDQAALDQALTEFSGSADAEGLADASDRIGTYLTENCEA
ncbi:MAG: hypothetical protein IE923_18100, partial [Micrococcales bacterium]|nr:hypothetical protein [Micrococcales bacterium]